MLGFDPVVRVRTVDVVRRAKRLFPVEEPPDATMIPVSGFVPVFPNPVGTV
jgi:hypothetical protein